MVAEAALTFNPNAAASELYRAQRQKQQPRKRRGKVLRFPARNANTPPATPAGLAQQGFVPEARTNTPLGTAADRLGTPNPETTPPTAVPANNNAFFDQIQDRQQRAQQEAFLRNKNQERIKALSSRAIPLDVLAIGDRIPEQQQQEALNVLDRSVNRIEQLADKLGQGKAFRKQKQKVIEQTKEELGKLAKKGVTKAVQGFYRLIGDAAPADVGELAYIELVVGMFVQSIRLFLTFKAVQRRGLKGSFAKYAAEYLGDEKAGNIGLTPPKEQNGIIKELLPGEMDLADPSVWIADIPLGILGWFILLVLFGITQIILALLGASAIVGWEIGDMFGGLLGL